MFQIGAVCLLASQFVISIINLQTFSSITITFKEYDVWEGVCPLIQLLLFMQLCLSYQALYFSHDTGLCSVFANIALLTHIYITITCTNSVVSNLVIYSTVIKMQTLTVLCTLRKPCWLCVSSCFVLLSCLIRERVGLRDYAMCLPVFASSPTFSFYFNSWTSWSE